MKALKFIATGILFGIVMAKSEAVSWYRIQEMFRFQSFNMYGIIGSAIGVGIIFVLLTRKFRMKDLQGQEIKFPDKSGNWKRYLFGGTIFGLGWAITGACPGPLFVNLGYGYLSMLLPIIGALFGTLLYGILRNKLPH